MDEDQEEILVHAVREMNAVCVEYWESTNGSGKA